MILPISHRQRLNEFRYYRKCWLQLTIGGNLQTCNKVSTNMSWSVFQVKIKFSYGFHEFAFSYIFIWRFRLSLVYIKNLNCQLYVNEFGWLMCTWPQTVSLDHHKACKCSFCLVFIGFHQTDTVLVGISKDSCMYVAYVFPDLQVFNVMILCSQLLCEYRFHYWNLWHLYIQWAV